VRATRANVPAKSKRAHSPAADDGDDILPSDRDMASTAPSSSLHAEYDCCDAAGCDKDGRDAAGRTDDHDIDPGASYDNEASEGSTGGDTRLAVAAAPSGPRRLRSA
jgi:hypothetical protein